MINKKLQDLIHMSNTGMPCLTVDQDFIIKDKDKMMQKGLKDVFHENLEGARFIAKAKENHQELVMSFMN